MGAFLQRSADGHPQGVRFGNLDDHSPILDDGVQSLSFRLEGVEQVVPYKHVRELLGFHKGAPEKVDVPPGMLDGFWNLISGEAHQ
jgi:hypothetical protein